MEDKVIKQLNVLEQSLQNSLDHDTSYFLEHSLARDPQFSPSHSCSYLGEVGMKIDFTSAYICSCVSFLDILKKVGGSIATIPQRGNQGLKILENCP